MKRIFTGAALAAAGIGIVTGTLLQRDASAGQGQQVPLFEVDPFWPKPLPNHWLMGSAVGVTVDPQDRVWVVNRTDSFNRRTEVGAATDPATGDCCLPAPAVLVFDADGALAAHWPGIDEAPQWPMASQRIAVDASGQVWIGGIGEGDVGVRRFSSDGTFVGAAGAPAPAAAVAVHAEAGEAFVADPRGRQVLVLDATTGDVKRSWGAYGGPADAAATLPDYAPDAPAAAQFRNVHCVKPSRDGYVYVCDRESNRIQVFRADGSFVAEKVIAPETLGEGSVWDLALSSDDAESFLYVADGSNMRVHVLDRASLDVLTSFGNGGRQPGQFYAVHSIATDSRGNIYTTETYEGKRVQKFTFRGMGPAPSRDQGTVWPRR